MKNPRARRPKRGPTWRHQQREARHARPAPRRRLDRFGDGGHRHRGRRHGRRRRLHQPRLSGQGHPVRLFDPAAVGRRRPGRAVRGVFLQRTRRDVSALQRRIQFPDPRLSSGVRISRGLGLGDGRFRRAGGAGGDGVRRIRQVGAARRPAAGAGHRRGLAGVAGATRRRQALQHLSTGRDDPESRADRRVPGGGICHRHAAAGLVRARRFPTSPISPARRSRSAWCS